MQAKKTTQMLCAKKILELLNGIIAEFPGSFLCESLNYGLINNNNNMQGDIIIGILEEFGRCSLQGTTSN